MKDNILQTAAEMFLSFGFKSVTMDDIANKMGISKKTIYTHFSNKTILVEEATIGLFDCLSSQIDLICEKSSNPIQELYDIRSFIMDTLKDEKSSPIFQLQKYYPAIHVKLLKRQFEVMKGCVTKNLSEGVQLGLYRKDIDINFIARVYFKGMTGIKDEETFSRDEFAMPYLIEKYIEYHIRGISTNKGIETLEQIQKSNKQ